MVPPGCCGVCPSIDRDPSAAASWKNGLRDTVEALESDMATLFRDASERNESEGM